MPNILKHGYSCNIIEEEHVFKWFGKEEERGDVCEAYRQSEDQFWTISS